MAANADFWNTRRMHSAYGFDRSLFEESYVIDERSGPWLSDRSFFAQTVARLTEEKRRFFAFLLSSSNHLPYEGSPQSAQLRVDMATAQPIDCPAAMGARSRAIEQLAMSDMLLGGNFLRRMER